jgi:hypothetical protein
MATTAKGGNREYREYGDKENENYKATLKADPQR